MNNKLQLSLCCIWLGDENCKFQSMTYKRFKSMPRKQALAILSSRILNNFRASCCILENCHKSNISGYRMSSSLAPLMTHPALNLKWSDLPDWNMIKFFMQQFGKIAKKYNIRISAHPSEYITLTSDNESSINNSIRDLNLHGEIFDRAGLQNNREAPLNIHIRQNGDCSELAQKFYNNLKKCSSSVVNRIVVENNDTGNSWSVSNLIKYVYEPFGIPVTFDILHRKFLSESTEQEDFTNAAKTWPTQPLFHYSEGKENTRHHREFPLDQPPNYNYNVMWDVELKGKNLAIQKILEKECK